MRVVSAAQMREADGATIARLGLPGIALMESAGRGATATLVAELSSMGVTISPALGATVFCGGGNNGGDGFVIARELSYLGLRCDVVLLGQRAQARGDAATNLRFIEALEREALGGPGSCSLHPWGDALADGASIDVLLDELTLGAVVVDAMLGTGLSSALRSPYSEVVAAINRSDSVVLAVDIPTGISSDTGAMLGAAVEATCTATFGAAKFGHWLSPGRELRGTLEVVEIGIPPRVYDDLGATDEVLDDGGICAILPARPAAGHKGTFGHVLALGGFDGKAGAIALCAGGVLRGGAGLATIASTSVTCSVAVGIVPEAMSVELDEAKDLKALTANKTCVAAGPGLGLGALAHAAVAWLIDSAPLPVVLDADALNLVADGGLLGSLATMAARIPVVLTPHPGEFARLTRSTVAEVIADPVDAARTLAAMTGAVVVLKMATTVVAHPDGRVALNSTGNAGMGTGGSGDVLTGLIAGLIAQGSTAWDAARAGVFVHGLAGDIAASDSGSRSLVAGDLVGALGSAFEAVCATR